MYKLRDCDILQLQSMLRFANIKMAVVGFTKNTFKRKNQLIKRIKYLYLPFI